MYVGGTIYDTTNFDPTYYAWDSPWDSQFYGETNYLQDNMPGVAATHAVFSSVGYKRCYTCTTWTTPPTDLWDADGPRYHYNGTTSLFGIWTDPLN
jgi:hypothetical protein